jgi:hypothetical protein
MCYDSPQYPLYRTAFTSGLGKDGYGTCVMLVLSRKLLTFHLHYVSSSGSAQSNGAGESKRSRAFLGTNRIPPTFAEGRIWWAIQRRTVLKEAPDRRAMSPARRYSGAAVICDRPVEVVSGCQTVPTSRRQNRGQPDAPAGARARSAQRAAQIGCS